MYIWKKKKKSKRQSIYTLVLNLFRDGGPHKFSIVRHDIEKGIFNAGSFTVYFQTDKNRIGGIMVSVLTSSVVDHGFEPRSGQTKDYKIGICCFSASTQH